MRGHGITAAGPSIEHASLDAIHLNELAMMNYRAHLRSRANLGGDQAAFRNKATARPGGTGNECAQNYIDSSWRYYCALTEA